ncbi:MAG: PAN domain-containing protein [Nitrospira sp.]
MHHHQLIVATVATCLLLGACAFRQDAPSTASTPSTESHEAVLIDLDKPLHFMTTDGADTVAPAGLYRVEATQDAQLRLLSDGQAPILIAADHTTHDIDLSIPFALTFAEREDQPHVLLLMPDGQALDAVGSLSGIRPREAQSVTRHYQFSPGSGTVNFGDGTNGQRLPSTQSTLSSSYRAGIGAVGNVGAGGELQMIQLQSLISQRQTALALTTAMLNAQNERFHLEYGMNRPGADYAQRMEVTPEACRASCSGDQTCQAFTFVKPPAGAPKGQCFLKRAVPAPVAAPCCISGKRKSAQEEIAGNIR